MTRYPLEPLRALLAANGDSVDIARMLNLNGTTARQYREEGVSWRVADRLATLAGYHPAEVWPEWTDDQIEASSTPCEECGEPFIPSNAKHRYCSGKCSKRVSARRRYWTDPEHRAAELERKREYHAECAEYVRAQARRRYWEDPERSRARLRARRRDKSKDNAGTQAKIVNDNDTADQGFSAETGAPKPSGMSGGHRTMQAMNDDIEGAA